MLERVAKLRVVTLGFDFRLFSWGYVMLQTLSEEIILSYAFL
jgi:hypothetical protein